MILTPNKIHPMYKREMDDAIIENPRKSKQTFFNSPNNSVESTEESEDSVNHPKHYKSSPSGIEVIEITEHMNFCRGNAIKYIMRAGIKNKNKEVEDLKKAIWYLNREIQRLEKESL